MTGSGEATSVRRNRSNPPSNVIGATLAPSLSITGAPRITGASGEPVGREQPVPDVFEVTLVHSLFDTGRREDGRRSWGRDGP